MKINYDKESDVLRIVIRDEPIQESEPVRDWLIIDQNKKGELIGLEFLQASRHIMNPDKINIDLPEIN